MPTLGEVAKRVLLGRRLATERLQQALLPKRVALPVYSSDALSSVAYATQELIVVLTVGGLAYLYLAPWVAFAVVVLLVLVVAAYRDLVRAYPSGGAEFEAATRNLGSKVGLVAGSAMLAGYALTVAVAVAAGVDNLVSAFPVLHDARIPVAVGLIALMALVNLRAREGGGVMAAPAYLFILAIVAMVLWGLLRTAMDDRPVAESAAFDVQPELTDLTGVALAILLLRAFAGGAAALTGVGAIANGVPGFRKPKRRNAATTLALMAVASTVMFLGVTGLATLADVRYTADPCDLGGFDCESQPQRTVIAQLAAAVFGDGTPLFFVVQVATVLVLLVAASNAFSLFPMLGTVLARHRYLPRQLHHRGDPLAFSRGILSLAAAAAVLVGAFQASVTGLVQLYLVVVFLSFTLGLVAMVRHCGRERGAQHPEERARAFRSQAVSAAAAVLAAIVLVVVAVTRFTEGVWLVAVLVAAVYALMRGIRSYYDRVYAELAPDEERPAGKLPSRVHAIVLVSRLHKPTLRALAYARSSRPDLLEAITVNINLEETQELTDEWDRRDVPVPLKVLDSPYREIARPVLDYVGSIRRESPRDLVVIYIPEYVVGRWWERLLHNQSVLRLRGRLLFTPGVMVTAVPWQLDSSSGS